MIFTSLQDTCHQETVDTAFAIITANRSWLTTVTLVASQIPVRSVAEPDETLCNK